MVTFKFKTVRDLKQAMHKKNVVTPNKREFTIIPSDFQLREFEELIEVIEYQIEGHKGFEYNPLYFYLCPQEINTEVIREITRELFSINVQSQDEDLIYDFYPSIIGSAIFLITQLKISKESPIYIITEDIIQEIIENLSNLQDSYNNLTPSYHNLTPLISYYQDLLESLHNYDITKIDCYNTYKNLFEVEDN